VARVTRILERRLGKPDPWEPEGDPLEVLLVTILSQNTNDVLRDRAYERLRERFATDEALLAAPVRSIAAAIRVCGLHRQKAERIKRVLRWSLGRFGALSLEALCRMPTEEAFAALASINGVGPKTAAVVLLFGCGRDIFPVDTHCHRTVRRLGFLPARQLTGTRFGREQTFLAMQPLVPKGKALSLHLNLIRLGRTICRAPRPRCYECPLVTECRFPDKVLEPPLRGR
jgi:endonuclease-3